MMPSGLPQHLFVDLGFSIGMFIFALIGLRFVVKNCFSIDLFDFRSRPVQLAAGLTACVCLYSVYQLIADPRRVARLGRRIAGREYVNAQRAATYEIQQQAEADVRAEKKLNPGSMNLLEAYQKS